jgi:hypothetical protein
VPITPLPGFATTRSVASLSTGRFFSVGAAASGASCANSRRMRHAVAGRWFEPSTQVAVLLGVRHFSAAKTSASA